MATNFRRVARWDRTTPMPTVGKMIRITYTAPFRTTASAYGDLCTVASMYEQGGEVFVVTSLRAGQGR